MAAGLRRPRQTAGRLTRIKGARPGTRNDGGLPRTKGGRHVSPHFRPPGPRIRLPPPYPRGAGPGQAPPGRTGRHLRQLGAATVLLRRIGDAVAHAQRHPRPAGAESHRRAERLPGGGRRPRRAGLGARGRGFSQRLRGAVRPHQRRAGREPGKPRGRGGRARGRVRRTDAADRRPARAGGAFQRRFPDARGARAVLLGRQPRSRPRAGRRGPAAARGLAPGGADHGRRRRLAQGGLGAIRRPGHLLHRPGHAGARPRAPRHQGGWAWAAPS